MRATASAATAAAVGAALLLGRWLAVRYAGLAPARRGFVLAVGLALDLVAFGFGMTGQTPALPAGLWSLFVVPLPGISFVVGATMLIECFTAAVSLADPRSTRRPVPCGDQARRARPHRSVETGHTCIAPAPGLQPTNDRLSHETDRFVSIHGWGVARGVEDGCGRHAV